MVTTSSTAARSVGTVSTGLRTTSEAPAAHGTTVLSPEELQSYADCLLTDEQLTAEFNELGLSDGTTRPTAAPPSSPGMVAPASPTSATAGSPSVSSVSHSSAPTAYPSSVASATTSPSRSSITRSMPTVNTALSSPRHSRRSRDTTRVGSATPVSPRPPISSATTVVTGGRNTEVLPEHEGPLPQPVYADQGIPLSLVNRRLYVVTEGRYVGVFLDWLDVQAVTVGWSGVGHRSYRNSKYMDAFQKWQEFCFARQSHPQPRPLSSRSLIGFVLPGNAPAVYATPSHAAGSHPGATQTDRSTPHGSHSSHRHFGA